MSSEEALKILLSELVKKHTETGDLLEPKESIKLLIEARNKARKDKDFKKSDNIRDELKKLGIILEDTKDGTYWK
jgi:cysteinyl-tRNA synthetase